MKVHFVIGVHIDNLVFPDYLVKLVFEYLGGNLKYGNNESGGAYVKCILNSENS